jgi:Amt family ammonium transporter
VGTAFAIVFIVSYAVFFVIKKTIGLRVTDEEEDAGLDISETGMYGYPEQFIPAPETATPAQAGAGALRPSTNPGEVTA